MILDRITDWIVTAWELIGLLFLSRSADPAILRRWDGGSDNERDEDNGPGSASPAGRVVQQPHFA